MGACTSSKNNSQSGLSGTGPGLPPQEIIPQPVEVSNLTPDLNNQISNQDNPIDNLGISTNQPINSTLEQNSNPIDNSLNISNQKINNSNFNVPNLNSDLNQNLNSDLNQNINNDLEQTVVQNQLISSINNGGGQILASGQPLGSTIYQSTGINNQPLHSTEQPRQQRMYLVVQMPQREIEITKLYEGNCLLDIEPFIAPDSCDEYEFYDVKGHSIDDLLYTPFNGWTNVQNTLRIKLVRAGLHFANDIRNYIARNTYLIGCLTFDKPNTFGLFIFNKMNNSTLSFEYSTNIYLQMKTVNQFSAYCNALNKLYISGGEISNNQATSEFTCVDLNEVQENVFVPTQLCKLQKPRYWHSMIFIPEKYIFIVGGPNETDVELYDIEKNISVIDSKLNTERCEPSLILVNNKFLYAIFGFHLYDSFINTIERCNIYKRRRNWENVEYKLSNTPNLVKAFFGVSYVSNNIILVSDKEGQNDLKPNYILSPGTGNIDTISDEGILNSRSSRLFAEKFFIPFTETESINLAFKSGEPKIFIINNENGAINELCLSES